MNRKHQINHLLKCSGCQVGFSKSIYMLLMSNTFKTKNT